jgi:2-polyprenyl-6-methoxyphenol hydroxylase-like FAD-dependent oxidoreductase
MNLAFAGGFDLGWKLAWVLRGWAGPDLLDTYERERRGVAEHNINRSTDPEGNPRPHPPSCTPTSVGASPLVPSAGSDGRPRPRRSGLDPLHRARAHAGGAPLTVRARSHGGRAVGLRGGAPRAS